MSKTIGNTIPIRVLMAFGDGSPDVGATLYAQVRRDTDGYFWDGTNWVSTKTDLTISHIANGLYEYPLDTGAVGFGSVSSISILVWSSNRDVFEAFGMNFNLDEDYVAATNTKIITDKLPTNNIMGSSDKDDHDMDIDVILADTSDMQPKVDSMNTRLPADPADQSLVEDKIDQAVDYLDGPDARDHTEIYNAVTAIQNNTRLKTSIPAYMQKPDMGDSAFRWSANLYDDTGNPENPDNNEILVRVFKNDGTAITANLFQDSGLSIPLANPTDTVNFPPASGWRAMKLITTGRFELFYKVSSTEDEEQLNIEFGWMEGGVGPIVFPRTTIVSDVKGDIEDIQSKVTDILEDTSTTIPDRIDTLESNLKAMPRMRVNAPCEMYVPQVKTRVNKEGGIGASDTTIPVLNIEGLPSSGLVKIDSELIKYDGIDTSTNKLTGCTRGAYGTVAATHTDNAVVKLAVVHQILLAVFDNEGNMVNADSTPTIEMFNWEHTQTLVPTNMTAVAGYTGLYYYDHIIVEGDTPANFYIRCEATLGGIPMVEDEPVVVIDKPASESVVVSTSGGGTGDYACDQNGWYDGSGTLHPWGDVLEGPVVDAESGAPLDDCYVTFYPVIGGEAIITDRPTAQTLTKPGGSWLAFVDAGTYLVVFKKEGYRIDNGGRIERTVG